MANKWKKQVRKIASQYDPEILAAVAFDLVRDTWRGSSKTIFLVEEGEVIHRPEDPDVIHFQLDPDSIAYELNNSYLAEIVIRADIKQRKGLKSTPEDVVNPRHLHVL